MQSVKIEHLPVGLTDWSAQTARRAEIESEQEAKRKTKEDAKMAKVGHAMPCFLNSAARWRV